MQVLGAFCAESVNERSLAVCPDPTSECVQEVSPKTELDLSQFQFRTTVPEASSLTARFKKNEYTESARWKSLEPHQQAYVSGADSLTPLVDSQTAVLGLTLCPTLSRTHQVNEQIDKAVYRILEVLETPRGACVFCELRCHR